MYLEVISMSGGLNDSVHSADAREETTQNNGT